MPLSGQKYNGGIRCTEMEGSRHACSSKVIRQMGQQRVLRVTGRLARSRFAPLRKPPRSSPRFGSLLNTESIICRISSPRGGERPPDTAPACTLSWLPCSVNGVNIVMKGIA